MYRKSYTCIFSKLIICSSILYLQFDAFFFVPSFLLIPDAGCNSRDNMGFSIVTFSPGLNVDG